jgi:hypothetical protein
MSFQMFELIASSGYVHEMVICLCKDLQCKHFADLVIKQLFAFDNRAVRKAERSETRCKFVLGRTLAEKMRHCCFDFT